MSVQIFIGKKPTAKKPEPVLNSRIRKCRICCEPFLNRFAHQLDACSKPACQEEANRRRARARYRRLNGVTEDRQMVKEATPREPPRQIKSKRENFPAKRSRLILALVPGAL